MRAWLEHAANLAHALRQRRTHDERMRWSRDRLDSYRAEQVDALVRYAAEHSPFYRALYGPLPAGRIELAQLPIVTKPALMAAYDDVVTDPRLRLARLQPHLAMIEGDDLFDGDFRVMTSSGSSGQKAVFAYDRTAWRGGFLAGSLRMTRLTGLQPRIPRPRIATVAAPDGKHMTFRGGASMDVGLYVTRRLAAASPIGELVGALERFRPDSILGYPSMLALLAEEQLAGRLSIAPKNVITSSEVRTPVMTALIREAWNIEPFNCLGLTETGIAAVDCAEHRGLHVFEDLCVLEVIDEANRPVPFGTRGSKVLVTNLYNRVQPIIRFEVSDLVTMTDEPCPCGVTFHRITALDGRSDDMLEIANTRIHPIQLRGALASDPRIIQYQVTQHAAQLEVQVVLAAGAPTSVTTEVGTQIARTLSEHGAAFPVVVRAVTAIPRDEGAGKLKLVRRATG